MYYITDIVGCGKVRCNMDVSEWLEKARERLRHWSCMVHTVFCTRFENHDTVIDMGMEHLEDFDNVFAYHTFLYDGTMTLCPFGI